MRARLLVTIAAAMLALPLCAHAEGEDPDAPAKPRPVRHKVAKKAVPLAPAGPVPYMTLNPGMVAPTAAPVPEARQMPPPPPPPAAAIYAPAPAVPSPRAPVTEITLKCDTVTNNGRKNLTRGTFYIDLFPSQVFPDEQADFKFAQVDPRHASLVRDSYCLDMTCDAKVSGSAYYLVNRVTKKGAALRITLNRADGAFYAEEITTASLSHISDHTGESGWCRPQKVPDALF